MSKPSLPIAPPMALANLRRLLWATSLRTVATLRGHEESAGDEQEEERRKHTS